MSKIKLDDSVPVIIDKLADGHEGARRTLLHITDLATTVDPSCQSGRMYLQYIDLMALYGEPLSQLHSEACAGELTKTLAMLRGVQLGILTKEELRGTIAGGIWERKANPDAVLQAVQEKVPGFGKPAAETPPIAPPAATKTKEWLDDFIFRSAN